MSAIMSAFAECRYELETETENKLKANTLVSNITKFFKPEKHTCKIYMCINFHSVTFVMMKYTFYIKIFMNFH